MGKTPDLRKIFEGPADARLVIKTKLFDQTIGTARYTKWTANEVDIQGMVNYQGNSVNWSNPFTFSVQILDDKTCRLVFSSVDLNINISQTFPYEYVHESKFIVKISSYQLPNGNTVKGTIAISDSANGGAKINPDLEEFDSNGKKVQDINNGIIIRPE